MPQAQIEAAGLTDVGLKRAHNEDSFLLADLGPEQGARNAVVTSLDRPSGGLLVVADGMGGAAAGEVASKMAVDTVRRYLHEKLPKARKIEDLAQVLQDAAREANAEIFAKGKGDKKLRGMGTTLTAALAVGDLLLVTQVGDSRAYVLRKGELTQITRDQSLVGQMIYEGKMSAEDARAKLPKNVILQAVGKKESLEPVLTILELRAGDRMILCSDGLSNLVKDEEIRELVGTATEARITCQVLVDLAKKRGGDDNITVVIARFTGDALREAEDGMIPFYEDVLAERGSEQLFSGETFGDRTIVRPPARTTRLPPKSEAPAPKPAAPAFQFDVDEVLGNVIGAAAPARAATAAPASPPPRPPATPAAPPVHPPANPMDALFEEAAAEEAPVEEAPVEEAPVEEAPVEEAPEELPVSYASRPAPEPEMEETAAGAMADEEAGDHGLEAAMQEGVEPDDMTMVAGGSADALSRAFAEAAAAEPAPAEQAPLDELFEAAPSSSLAARIAEGELESTEADAEPGSYLAEASRPVEEMGDKYGFLEKDEIEGNTMSAYEAIEEPPPPSAPRNDLAAAAAASLQAPRDGGRFAAKGASGEAPWSAPVSTTEAMQRAQASLDDSGIFKHGDTGAHRAPRGSTSKMLVAAVAAVVVVGGAALLIGLGRKGAPSGPSDGPRRDPSPRAGKQTKDPASSPSPETTPAPEATQPPTDVAPPPEASPGTPTPETVAPPKVETPPPPKATPTPPKATPTPSVVATKVATPAPPPPTKGPRGKKTPAAAEAPAMPKTGFLSVATEPDHAYIKVNGELKGVSPMEIELPIGEAVNLLVYKVGYQSHHDPAFVMSEPQKELALDLPSAK